MISALTRPRAPPAPQSGSGAHVADVHDGTPRSGEALLKAEAMRRSTENHK
eukprot:COSAG01_NODE_9395_length_2456_cov_1.263783_3_plen_51_part_00